MKREEIKNVMYNEIADYDLNANVFNHEFYGWHVDSNLPVYRMYIGDSKRSYIDVCVDCTYLLVHDSEKELFNKYCDMLDVKKLAYRKKSKQYVAKLNTETSIFSFLFLFNDIVATQKQVAKAHKKELVKVC